MLCSGTILFWNQADDSDTSSDDSEDEAGIVGVVAADSTNMSQLLIGLSSGRTVTIKLAICPGTTCDDVRVVSCDWVLEFIVSTRVYVIN